MATIVLLLSLATVVVAVFGIPYGCKPCDGTVRCPALPDDCEVTRRPCGCCEECAGKRNEPCSAFTVRCASEFACMTERGEALETAPWLKLHYRGSCQPVVVTTEVIENTAIEERRPTRRLRHRGRE